MNINKEMIYKYKESIIIVCTIIQFYIYTIYPFASKKSNESADLEINTTEEKSFAEINEDLKSIENLNIIQMEKSYQNWNIEVCITGEKKNIINSMEKLKEYKIKKYTIDGNKYNLSLILEIYR